MIKKYILPRVEDLTGKQFGKLTVIEFSHKSPKEKPVGRFHYYWKCKCECGTTSTNLHNNLRHGQSKSCGCENKKHRFKRIHGLSQTYFFKALNGMKDRCRNPNSKYYKYYGARGIKICERWLSSVKNFADDMGSRPSKNHSVDRINNEGDYCLENCKWATKKEQARNRRSSKIYTINGVTKTLPEWLDDYRLTSTADYSRITKRLDAGWDIEKALKQKTRGEVELAPPL